MRHETGNNVEAFVASSEGGSEGAIIGNPVTRVHGVYHPSVILSVCYHTLDTQRLPRSCHERAWSRSVKGATHPLSWNMDPYP